MGVLGDSADGAAEEYGACPVAEVGHEVLQLGCLVPAAHAHVEPELDESFGVRRQLGVSDFADEDGRVLAVDEPARIPPDVEAGCAAGDLS